MDGRILDRLPVGASKMMKWAGGEAIALLLLPFKGQRPGNSRVSLLIGLGEIS
jgi:hypothetical protein